eukprot:250513-Rhodomonas_salina.1
MMVQPQTPKRHIEGDAREWGESTRVGVALCVLTDRTRQRRSSAPSQEALCEAPRVSRARVTRLWGVGGQRLKTMSTPLYSAVSANNKFAMMDDAFTG